MGQQNWAALILTVAKEQSYYSMIEATISVGDPESLVLVLGTKDQHLKQIRETIPAKISTREGKILVQGEEDAVLQATAVLEELRSRIGRNGPSTPIWCPRSSTASPTATILRGPIRSTSAAAATIRPRTAGQAGYVEAIRKNDLVFCIGPAGTGKTYLAVAMAVEALKARDRSARSCWCGRRSKRAKAWAFCPATCRPRSIPTCGRCWTRCGK